MRLTRRNEEPTRESTLWFVRHLVTAMEIVEGLRREAVTFDAETWEELRQAHACLLRARHAMEVARDRRGWS